MPFKRVPLQIKIAPNNDFESYFGFLHTGAPVHGGSRGGQVKGLMIKVGAKVAGDLISSSSLFSFTRGGGLGAVGGGIS